MGGYGPVPKRSEERIRRNKPEVPVEKVWVSGGRVDAPALGLVDPHPIIEDFWESLALSAQSRFYEPSDWQFARFTLHFADGLLKAQRPSAQLLQAVNANLGELLVSEGSRRRVRLEVERSRGSESVVGAADLIRQRLAEAA